MNLLRFIQKPEYFFRPSQVVRRGSAFFYTNSLKTRVKTPWGDKLFVNGNETIGKSLVHMGVYDLALTECLWRIVDQGMVTADIGANVGYFSLLLSQKVGKQGKVFCFEPHPKIFEKLKENLKNISNCALKNWALSNKKGVFDLYIPQDFLGNEGVASLEKEISENSHSKGIQVDVEVLDEVLKTEKLDLIKIDVEGHELSVFEGGKNILKNVSHVFFEDFKHTKSPAIELLNAHGFEVFRIKKSFWGPVLISVEQGETIPLWEPPNYLATRKSTEVFQKLAPRGWQCLKGK